MHNSGSPPPAPIKKAISCSTPPGCRSHRAGWEPCRAGDRAGTAAQLPHGTELLHRTGAELLAPLLVHLDGAGVAAMEPLLLPDKKLTPVQLTGVRMQELFELVLEQMELGTVDSMVQTGLALHEMLALCAQSLFAQAEMTTNRQLILQAAETLRKNYRQELSLADLLSSAHMSKSYFLRLFRRYMGTTPYNYLVNFRITQAKELLVLTDHSISEIAQEAASGMPVTSPPALPRPPARARCSIGRAH